MAIALSPKDMPTLTDLYADAKLSASAKPAAEPSTSINDRISTIQHDITKLAVGAIVNAANSSLLGGGGVDGAIHRAAGPQLLEECSTLDGCETGSAKITKGYKLPAAHVVHAVGPVFSSPKEAESAKDLAGCYRTALELAAENGCKSIAFSAISTGIYGYPSTKAADKACETVREFLDGKDGDKIERVVFCNFLDKDVDAYQDALPKYFPKP